MDIGTKGFYSLICALRLIVAAHRAGSHREKPISDFFAELRRRRVFRVIVLYAIAGWIVIEVTSTVLPGLNLPEWTTTLVILLVALGFVIAVMLAWAFDIGPGGIQRTPSTSENDPEPAAVTPVQPAQSAPSPTPASIDDTDDNSIAVLPFVNMSGMPRTSISVTALPRRSLICWSSCHN